MKGRLFYINRISDQLAVLAASIRLANQSNRSDINVMAEQLLCGLLNRIYGWHLTNVNFSLQKYPGVDLCDPDVSIAVQVTAANRLEKVRHTLEEFSNHHLDKVFDRLIILVLTTDSPTKGMQHQRFEPWFYGERDIWNFPYLLNSIQDLDIPQLKEIFNYLTAELSTTVTVAPSAMPTHVLPALPELAASFVPNSRDREVAEIGNIYHYPNNDHPLFLWGASRYRQNPTGYSTGKIS